MPGAKILIIDDETQIRGFFQALLLRLGYEAITAEDGIAGLEAYYAHLPELVIVNIFMPCKNGLEVIQEIRDLHRVFLRNASKRTNPGVRRALRP